MRRLSSSLIAEDASDVAFLLPLLQAQLDGLSWDAEFIVDDIYAGDVTTVTRPQSVFEAAAELLEYSDLLFVHHDSRESEKIDRIREQVGAGNRLVAVVPVRETEAWVLAAACTAAKSIALFDSTAPEKGCKWFEKVPDPKAELRARYRGRRSVEDLFTLIAQQADLARMADVPAYRSFLQDLTTALKELNFR
jgi:hypothetical protein